MARRADARRPATTAPSWTRPATPSARSAPPTRRGPIVLLGHIDTVPGNIPVRIESTADGDVLYGRGSVDAKGPLATFVAGAARFGAALGARRTASASSSSARSRKKRRPARARASSRRASTARREPIPAACVIGEPSHWHRITLGYKGRLLLDLIARPADGAHRRTRCQRRVGRRRSVELGHRARRARQRRQGQGLRSAEPEPAPLHHVDRRPRCTTRVDAQIAWRLPLGFDADAFIDGDRASWPAALRQRAQPRRPSTCQFRGFEQPWRGDRQNALVRSFLAAIRAADRGRAAGLRRSRPAPAT